ncbi:MAG: aldo/keto reductase [Planctomycetes bacterium]|nr:aldo/keto reductase [Planctomycetota bacterium]
MTTLPTGRIVGIAQPISRAVLGTMIVNTDRQAESDALLDDALARGINALDCAHIYGGGASEAGVGAWMKARGNRERVVILTKGSHPYDGKQRVTPECMQADLADSLKRLQTGYVDGWMFHRDDPKVPVGPLVETANALIKQGKVRSFGASNWSTKRIGEYNDYARDRGLVGFSASSVNFGLAEQFKEMWDGCISLAGVQGERDRAWYAQQGIPVFAFSSMGRGFFSGRAKRAHMQDRGDMDEAGVRAFFHEPNFKRLDRVEILAKEKGLSVPQIALGWLMSHPLGAFALVGAANRAEIEDTVKGLNVRLTPEECAWLDLRSESCAKSAR